MQYVLLTNQFGGLNTYLTHSKVGPNGAVEATGVDITEGSLQNRWNDTIAPLNASGIWVTTDTYVPATSKTIVPWGTGALGMTGRYAIARFGGKLYRSHKGFGAFPSDLQGIQYTSNTSTPPTWDYLGLMTPAALGSVTDASPAAGLGVPAGTITYYCTFYNDAGHESPPATSTEKTITSAKKLTVTLPQSYGTCTVVGGSSSLTAVTNIASFRLGMRITGTNIQADTYITAIDTSDPSNHKLTISKAASGSATTTNVKIIDAQVAGTRLYRLGGGIETPLLVTQTAGLATASYADEKTNEQLGEELTTANTSDMPNYLRDISISPAGVLLCAGPENTVRYFSLVTPGLYNPAQVITAPDSPLATIYALNRFICPTIRGAFTVTIDDAILGLPILQSIDDTEPCQVSYFVYPVDVGGEVWWNTNKGIVSTNGDTIETITRYTLNRYVASAMTNAYGADFYNGTYFLYAENETGTASLYSFSKAVGWGVVSKTLSKSSPGAIGWHINDGCMIYTGDTTGASAEVLRLQASQFRLSGGVYRTGEWVGAKQSALKKFRKVSALLAGSASIQPYVDGQAVGSALVGSSVSTAKPERVSWWLPAGTKGRAVSLRVTLTGSFSNIQELGVWVGEEREAMP